MKQQIQSISSQASLYIVAVFAALSMAFAGAMMTTSSAHAASSGQCGSITNSSQLSIENGAKCGQGNDQPQDLFGSQGIFTTVTNVLLFIIGAVSVIMLIIGGIRYTISNGDQGAVTSAKNTILYAIIGLVVAILAYAAVNFVVTQFAA